LNGGARTFAFRASKKDLIGSSILGWQETNARGSLC
jgi:hypothetical protein